MDLSQRLDEMELAIHKPSFRKGTGRANEVNYWVFDYPPEKELEVRERVEYLKNKNDRGDDDFELVVFDLYDIIIDFLEKKNFMEKCYDFEKKRGIERIVKAVTNSMKVNDDDSLIVQYIKEHTPENAVVFLTGIGKWLFDSGKQNGFKALVYLHRYTPDTIGNLRIDYLHKMQRVYESEINRMQDMMDHSGNAREVAAASKRKDKLAKQLKECREYDEKISHLALSRIELDLDDGVKVNYRKLQTAQDGKFYEVLADSKNIMVKEKK